MADYTSFRGFWSKSINEYPVFESDPNVDSHGYDSSNFFTKYTLAYVWPLILKGYKKPLQLNDLSLAPIKLHLVSCYKSFLNNVIPNDSDIDNIDGKDVYYFTFNVNKTLWKMSQKYVIIAIFCMIMNALLMIGGVFAFRELIEFLYEPNEAIYMGIIWALLISFSGLLSYFSLARMWINAEKAGIITRNTLMSLLYRKVLKIPTYITETDTISNGEISNLMSNGMCICFDNRLLWFISHM